MPTLYLSPKHYEQLHRYLTACSVVSSVIETSFDNDHELDECDEYEHKYKKRLLVPDPSGTYSKAFDDSTDAGESQMLDCNFALTCADRISYEGYDADGKPCTWNVYPAPIGWYSPTLAP